MAWKKKISSYQGKNKDYSFRNKLKKEKKLNDTFESINFKYSEQSDFSYKRLSEFDAEALISIENNLLIFTKNRAKKISDIYILPKTKGEYDAKKMQITNRPELNKFLKEEPRDGWKVSEFYYSLK